MRRPWEGRVLVVGLGAAGTSAVRALVRQGADVVVVDDRADDAAAARAAELGARLVPVPGEPGLAGLLGDVDLVVPSPAVAEAHPVVTHALDRGVPVWSEFELAARWGHPPVVAVTGTNGKTTVVTLVADMLAEAGHRTAGVGNTEVPLVDALDGDHDWLVVEASSFRLRFAHSFRPRVAVWLNLAEDHLDWHPDMAAYAAAKARVWQAQEPDDVAVVNAEDPAVMAAAREAPGRVVTFGVAVGDHRLDGDRLVGPDGAVVARTGDLWRALPHDVANALAAAAAAREAGVPPEAVGAVLRRFRGLPHRVSLVAEAGGVRWYDDSKATVPHAVLAALAGFDSAVLVAGGRNKGSDLSLLADAAGRLRGVVAIGEAAGELVGVFAGRVPVEVAGSMDDAVALAAGWARPGDAVVLSPGCASYDWYRSYGERGEDFERAVRERLAGTGEPATPGGAGR